MAWVTKNSEETYTPEPAPREYTKKEKAANWWHYHKVMLFVIAAVVILVVWIIHDVVAQVEPDLQVAYVGSTELPSDTVDALENALLPYCTDRNGDGEVIVQLNQFTVTFGDESQDADPYSQMAGITKLSAELAADSDTYLFLLADPEGFQEQTQALQYTDGTLPPEEGADDWQRMVYRWKDCPVLSAMDLGDYTLLGETAETAHSNQELLGSLYVACRGNWSEEVPEAYTESLALWDTLTLGAVSVGAAL